MASRTSRSILGDFRGTIGPTVFTQIRDVAVAKSKPLKRKKSWKPTVKQKVHMDTFGDVSNFLKDATDVINLGYQKPKKPKMSCVNEAVSWHYHHALSADQKDGVLDLTKLKWSNPIRKTQKAWKPTIYMDENFLVSLTWELNPLPQKCTRLDDRVVFVMHRFFNNKHHFFFDPVTAMRKDLHYSIELSKTHQSMNVHVYLFMISADKKLVSETQYLGKLT